MNRFVEWLLQSRDRKLEVSVGGRWFILFTIVLGVVAIFSGNNVIYLLESMLLSAFILSGVLSELTIGKPKLRRILNQAHAQAPTRDIIELTNPLPIPLYCIEILEENEDGIVPIGFVVRLPAKGKVRVSSEQIIGRRGTYAWSRLVLATSFPFGFARKLRFVSEGGVRIVWPLAQDSKLESMDSLPSRNREWEVVEGELLESQGDYSKVHWPSSLRAGEMMERARRPHRAQQRVELWLEAQDPQYENKISGATFRFLTGAQELVLHWSREKKVIQGQASALDALSLLPNQGSGS